LEDLQEMRITFLGLGQMGSNVARLLLERGYDLTVWNRSPKAAEPLQKAGATVATTPKLAVADADVVFTMVHDDQALESILFEQGALEAIRKGATHISLSTISPALADHLDQEHAKHGHQFIASPVFGRPAIAAEGKLWLAIAGKDEVLTPLLPVLETFSRGYTIVGQKPSAALAVKVAGNFLITSMIAALSESMVVADAHGIEPALFLETVNNALFQSTFYANYGKVMLNPQAEPSATVSLGAKDTRLFREAAASTSTPTPLGDHFQKQLEAAAKGGLADADWAAGYYQFVQQEAQQAKGVEAK
jgi:3-hydroxyisobutyrate dehydrogenase-like beta-hydroxyacid dehydrogenase